MAFKTNKSHSMNTHEKKTHGKNDDDNEIHIPITIKPNGINKLWSPNNNLTFNLLII